MTARVRLERMLLRDSIVVQGESALNYLLVKLFPGSASDGSNRPAAGAIPLNVALVLDVSGSMYDEQRLENVQTAVHRVLDLLKPTDLISLVAFGEDARVVLPAAPARDPQRIRDCITAIGSSEVDPGGTSMHLGMAEGVRQIRSNFSPDRFNRVVVLTDGQTRGEEECSQIVRAESANGISFSVVGVGTDWNENLLKELSTHGKGNWHYIDSATKAQEVFRDEFQQLASTAFNKVRLTFHGAKDVVVKKNRQVVPECMDLPLECLGEREWVMDLQTLQNDVPRAILLDLALPRRPPGQYVVGRVECVYDIPTDRVTGESTGPFEVRVTYTDDPSQSYANAQVAKYIDELQTFEVAAKIHTALAQGDKKKATMLAQNLHSTATRLGAAGAKKTQLANQVLAELQQGGTLSRKTQLALNDGARKTELAE